MKTACLLSLSFALLTMAASAQAAPLGRRMGFKIDPRFDQSDLKHDDDDGGEIHEHTRGKTISYKLGHALGTAVRKIKTAVKGQVERHAANKEFKAWLSEEGNADLKASNEAERKRAGIKTRKVLHAVSATANTVTAATLTVVPNPIVAGIATSGFVINHSLGKSILRDERKANSATIEQAKNADGTSRATPEQLARWSKAGIIEPSVATPGKSKETTVASAAFAKGDAAAAKPAVAVVPPLPAPSVEKVAPVAAASSVEKVAPVVEKAPPAELPAPVVAALPAPAATAPAVEKVAAKAPDKKARVARKAKAKPAAQADDAAPSPAAATAPKADFELSI